MYDAKTVAQVLTMREQGHTYATIAATAGVHERTVANMLERVGRTKKQKRRRRPKHSKITVRSNGLGPPL